MAVHGRVTSYKQHNYGPIATIESCVEDIICAHPPTKHESVGDLTGLGQ